MREEDEIRKSMDAFKAWRERPLSADERRILMQKLISAPPLITTAEFIEATLEFDIEDICIGYEVDELFNGA